MRAKEKSSFGYLRALVPKSSTLAEVYKTRGTLDLAYLSAPDSAAQEYRESR